MMIKRNLTVQQDIESIITENLPWQNLSGKTILVTGANGFIPSYIIETLLLLNEQKILSDRVKVIGLVRNLEKANAKFEHLQNRDDFFIYKTDLNEQVQIDSKINYIIHAASQASPKYYGKDPVGTLKTNTLGTARLLDLAVEKKIEKFIFISSGEVYGKIDDDTGEISETYTGKVDITDVRSCYAESKRMGETMCVCWSHQFHFPVNMLRLSHTYGPGVSLNDGRVFADLIKNIVMNEDIVLNSDGQAKRSFCYISDMIRALFFIFFLGEPQNAYNIASTTQTKIIDLAQMLVNLFPEKNLTVKCNTLKNKSGYIQSKSTSASFSLEKLNSLGWKEKTDLQTGFKRMIESYNS